MPTMADVFVNDWNRAISKADDAFPCLISSSSHGWAPESRITSWKAKANVNSVGIQITVVWKEANV